MRRVTQKQPAGTLPAVPKKRSYWAIINDYDLLTGLCELVDNAIDNHHRLKRPGTVTIDIALDAPAQIITIEDDAGGVATGDLENLVAPGATVNDPLAESIGIFGVGSKRAVIALARQAIVRTSGEPGKAYEIVIDDAWLESPDWDIPYYVIPVLKESSTFIELSKLRRPFTDEEASRLHFRLGEIYALFLEQGVCCLRIDGVEVRPLSFEHWAYPPSNPPRLVTGLVRPAKDIEVSVSIKCGLINDRDAVAENYGVCFYCNDRLIERHVRNREVGYFIGNEAGVPHPDASLCRAVVAFAGPARYMPWNSSKTAIQYDHPAFTQLRPQLVQLVSHFSKLSRRWKRDWQGQVFSYPAGQFVTSDLGRLADGPKLVLPPVPRANKRRIDVLKTINAKKLDKAPWLIGYLESAVAGELLTRQGFLTGNRLALIILDSTFEIALKDYIVHNRKHYPPHQWTDTKITNLFQSRTNVMTEVRKHANIPQGLVDLANHYYDMRNNLIHRRITVDVLDQDIEIYEKIIVRILGILFKLSFDV